MSTSVKKQFSQIEYPDEDGFGMPEGDAQREYISYATKVLHLWFRDRPDVYASGNLFVYYEEGNPSAAVAPDTFVVFGVDKRDRNTYKTWEEGGKLPDFALEITSASTAARDKRNKFALYQKLGVNEYFQYDPTGKYLKPQSLVGFALDRDRYEQISSKTLPDGILAVTSEILELDLHLRPDGLRFYDPTSAQYLLTHEEEAAARSQERLNRLEAERARVSAERAKSESELKAQRLAERLRSLGIDPDEI